jgi:hypothetical protein
MGEDHLVNTSQSPCIGLNISRDDPKRVIQNLWFCPYSFTVCIRNLFLGVASKNAVREERIVLVSPTFVSK